MSFINYSSREINCKIVYYGPGLCGKTTNLQWIYDKTNPNAKGKLISLATETDRTLFFDFLPLELGTVRGFKTRFHLSTAPAPRPGARLQAPLPPLPRPRPGRLRREPQADPEGRRRRDLRGRQPARAHGRESRGDREPGEEEQETEVRADDEAA